MKNAFIQLERLIREWDGKHKNPLSSGQRSILLELGARESEGAETRITDLVQQIRFGTGPTVHSHLQRLESDRLLTKTPSKTDGRSMCLSLTKTGRDYLQALDTLVHTATACK